MVLRATDFSIHGILEASPAQAMTERHLQEPFRFTFPAFRYEVWEAKDGIIRARAGALKYTSDSWNYVTLNPIESLSFETLQARGGLPLAASMIGFTEDTWDCFIKYIQVAVLCLEFSLLST